MSVQGAGGGVTVGGTAAQLTSTSRQLKVGTQIEIDPGNTGTVAVGFASTVTITTGYVLGAAGTVFIPASVCDDPSLIYVIGSASGQVVGFLCG